MTKVFVGSDHAGFELKKEIIKHLTNKSIDVNDSGTYTQESVDYPDFAAIICEEVARQQGAFGILICGSGIGMTIAANRNPKIRAALCHNAEYAKLAREHNNANVLVLGARFLETKQALSIIDIFLQTNFTGGRHAARIAKL